MEKTKTNSKKKYKLEDIRGSIKLGYKTDSVKLKKDLYKWKYF